MSTEPVKRGRGRPPKPPGEKITRRKITRPVDPEDVRWFQVECDTRGLTGPQLFRAMRESLPPLRTEAHLPPPKDRDNPAAG